MIHQLLFLALYLGLMPLVLMSPFVGVLIYDWIDYLPPGDIYSASLLSNYLSLTIGALTFLVWLFREEKTIPRPLSVMLLMVALLIWMNITWQFALAPWAGRREMGPHGQGHRIRYLDRANAYLPRASRGVRLGVCARRDLFRGAERY